MENQLIVDFGCDMLVAKYALAVAQYRSVEEALEVIFGAPGDQGAVAHPFFGYVPSYYVEPEKADAGNLRPDLYT